MSPTSPLSIAQLAIYSILALPLIYNLIRHGKHGFLGWIYLVAFAILRLTGSGLALSSTASSGAVIISNVGLSPLLLGTLGILHEGRHYRLVNLNHKLEIALLLAMHMLVGTAVGLIAVGVSGLSNDGGDSSKGSMDESLLKIGILLMLTAWLVISFVALVSLYIPVHRYVEDQVDKERKNGGEKLLTAVLISAPLIGVRVIYSVAADFTQSATLNAVTGSLAIRVCLSVVPELLVTIIFILFGLWTRNISQNRHLRSTVAELRVT